MQYINKSDIKNMAKIYRAQFINSLSGPKSANLIGTIDKSGQTNLSIVSSCVHLGADPPLVGMVIRPRSVPRHTLDNLLETGYYTINHIHKTIAKAAHQTSARYPKEVSEFSMVGLNEQYLKNFIAPYVRESEVKMGMKFLDRIHFTFNDTEFIVGEIVAVHFPENILSEEGSVNIAKANSLSVTGLDHYHELKALYRLSYAKPGKDIKEID